ncbi:GINS complex, Psf3 component [Backusella circina FSU 941]|nr:GINS complex, Psf3 component [Backusella circina FSU 941]
MENDEYYDIDCILAEQTKIPCTALIDFSQEINLTGDGSVVEHNSRIELPYWVAKPLAQITLPDESSLISIELPKMYGTKVRNVLDADPMTVDYRILCPYFYLFGLKLLEFIVDEALPGILEKAFKDRMLNIMNFAQTSGHVIVGNEFIQKLDETEKELYKLGQESFTKIRQWRKNKQRRIRTIDLPRPSTQ